MDWMSLVPCCKGGLSTSHSSCFCLLKPLQFVLVLFSSRMQQGLVQSLTSSTMAKELLATHSALTCSVHPRAKSVLSVQGQTWALSPTPVSPCKWDGRCGEASPKLRMAPGVSVAWFWHHPGYERRKGRSWDRQLCWEGGTAEPGSLAVLGVCSHESSPAPSQCNCRDKVGAAWKSQGRHNFQLRRKRGFTRSWTSVLMCVVPRCDEWALSHSSPS